MSAGLDGGTQCESSLAGGFELFADFDFSFPLSSVMSFIASFALFGAGGNQVDMPFWALNR